MIISSNKQATIIILSFNLLLQSVCLYATPDIVLNYSYIEQCSEEDILSEQENNIEEYTEDPTILESWSKVVRCRWNDLTRADFWNIGASIGVVGSAGLFYYCIVNKKNTTARTDSTNPYHGNGFGRSTKNNMSSGNYRNNINDEERDSSSDESDFSDDLSDSDDSNNDDNPASLKNSSLYEDCYSDNNMSRIFFPQICMLTHKMEVPGRSATAKMCFFEDMTEDPQRIIAQYMIHDFLASAKTPVNHSDMLFVTTISNDGTRIVSAISSHRVKIWSIYNQEFYIFSGHTRQIVSIAISPNNAYVITGSLDNTVNIWDMYTGELNHRCVGHTSPVSIIGITDDSKYAITVSGDMMTKKWDITTGQLIQTTTGYEDYSYYMMLYCPAKIYADQKKTITEIKKLENSEVLCTMENMAGYVSSLAINADNSLIIAGGSKKEIRIIPLTVSLNEQKNKALHWIEHNILPRHAYLIIRAAQATQENKPFVIRSTTTDAIVWINFPPYVRDYLRTFLNIQLKK
jgi:WD40 repeat protein